MSFEAFLEYIECWSRGDVTQQTVPETAARFYSTIPADLELSVAGLCHIDVVGCLTQVLCSDRCVLSGSGHCVTV